MSEFQLDTSGLVFGNFTGEPGPEAMAWESLTPFQQGYVEAMIASTFPLGWIDCAESADYHVPAFSDLAPATLARIIGDCEAHEKAYPLTPADPRRHGRGRNFWRNRHAGMWSSLGWAPLTVFLGDDGLIYLREAA